MSKPFRIWIICAAAFRVLTLVLLGFFVLSRYGFVHLALLHWLTYLSGVHLLVSLTVWLCREKLHTRGKKIALSITAAFIAMAVGLVFFIASLFMAVGATTMYTPYQISRSPQGTNRAIVYVTGFDRDNIVAAPMVNRWVYRRTPSVWVPHRGLAEHFSVTWAHEQLAVVELPDSEPIAVAFD